MSKFAAVFVAVAALAIGCRECQAQPIPPDNGAVFGLQYQDAFDRMVSGTASIGVDYVELDLMLVGDDGATHFTNVFPRVSEAGGSPETEVVVFTDFDGLLGGSVYFEGLGLLSTSIGIGTVPVIEAGGVVVWNQQTQFASAGDTGPATTDLVNVPEPASLSFTTMFSAALIGVGVLFKLR